MNREASEVKIIFKMKLPIMTRRRSPANAISQFVSVIRTFRSALQIYIVYSVPIMRSF